MSVMDYCSSFESDKELNCYSSLVSDNYMNYFRDISPMVAVNWYYIPLTGVTWLTPSMDMQGEWTMSRYGFLGSYYGAWFVGAVGGSVNIGVNYEFATRPVFYLASDVELSGAGTIENPFRTGIE